MKTKGEMARKIKIENGKGERGNENKEVRK